MADRIILKGMTFYGRHGVLPREKEAGQPFVVDLVLYLDLEPAGRRDDLDYTVDYSQVFDAVKRVVEGERFNLVEALASTIAERVLAGFPVQGVRVRVKKPMAPVGGDAGVRGGRPAEVEEELTVAYLGLGANLGDREMMLARAAARLDACPGIRVLRRSSLYETEPVGPAGQPWYLNAVLEVETSLSPLELLGACKQIEADLGRRPGVRWGPRPIDIDILLFGHVEVSTPELVIPHPELRKRAFVLVPLAEVAADLLLPGGGTVRSVLAVLDDPHRVRLHREAWPAPGESTRD